jgi:xanthine dehydrogenase accessory factor
MLAIWRAAVDEFEHDRDFVLSTILSVRGSSPRHVGTRFLVRRDKSIVGTIGGGLFEANVQEFSLSALKECKSYRIGFAFQGADPHAAEMICGGEAEVLVEYVSSSDATQEKIFRRLLELAVARETGYLFTDIDIPLAGVSSVPVCHLLADKHGVIIGGFTNAETAVAAMPQQRLLKPAQLMEPPGFDHPVLLEWVRPKGTVYILGAGHVGECVAHLAAYVDFRVVVIDDRAEFANSERIAEADEIRVVESFDHALSHFDVDEDSYIVIVTRGHAHDRTALSQALRTQAGYIGMIGSRRKIGIIYQAILNEGFSRHDLERVHAPIGLPIGGETPQEIGVSIVAQMIGLRNRKDQLGRLG